MHLWVNIIHIVKTILAKNVNRKIAFNTILLFEILYLVATES